MEDWGTRFGQIRKMQRIGRRSLRGKSRLLKPMGSLQIELAPSVHLDSSLLILVCWGDASGATC